MIQTASTSLLARMGFDQYRALDALSVSTLKHAGESLLQFKQAFDNPSPDTTAKRLGRATHTSVLEPDDFPRRYVVIDPAELREIAPPRSSKEGKRVWAEYVERHPDAVDLDSDGYQRAIFGELHPGKEVLTDTAYESCLRMRDAVRRHPVAGPLVAKGRAELSLVWRDEESGLACRMRPDFIPDDRDDVIVDLKTARAPFPWMFGGAAAKLGYHLQAAFYERGWRIVTGQIREMHLIAVQNVAPWEVWVYTLPAAVVKAAWEEQGSGLASLLMKVKWAREKEAELIAAGRDGSEAWPGDCREIHELQFPAYVPGMNAIEFTDTDAADDVPLDLED